MIKENRVIKYLLYALGEIVLVIIGILIALQINNHNEIKKNEAKVEAILKDIQRDLISDISQAAQVKEVYNSKDSLLNLVLEGKLSIENYQKNPTLTALITTYVPYEIKDNGYKNLMGYSDFITAEYDSIIPLLDNLYLQNQHSLQYMNKQLSTYVTDLLEKWSEKYTWYLDLNRGRYSPEASAYLLENPFYKNEVVTYQTYATQNLLRMIGMHELGAILAYKAIANELNYPKELPAEITNFMIDLNPTETSEIVGYYSVAPNFGVTVSSRNGRLFAQATGQQAFEVYAKSARYVFNPVVDIQIKFTVDESENVIGFELKQSGRTTPFKKEAYSE